MKLVPNGWWIEDDGTPVPLYDLRTDAGKLVAIGTWQELRTVRTQAESRERAPS